jgi:hypothetical protein
MIVNFYIEVTGMPFELSAQDRLEAVLQREGFAFYDATRSDILTREGNYTLDEIEAELGGK